MRASDAVEHPFIKLAYTRGLGDRINIEKLRGYMFRRKWEVRAARTHTHTHTHTHTVCVYVCVKTTRPLLTVFTHTISQACELLPIFTPH